MSSCPDPARYAGVLQFAGATLIAGWAVDRQQPDRPVVVEILIDGDLVTRVAADGPAAAGEPAAHRSFELAVPRRFRDGRHHQIAARFAESGQDLAHSPRRAFCPFDLSEPLPRQDLDHARNRALREQAGLAPTLSSRMPQPMKIHLVCYEELDDWILGKITRKLQEHLTELGMTVTVGREANPNADLNHHIIYWGYVDRKQTPETIMITHIDNHRELGKVKQQLVELGVEMGICMSREAVHRLAQFGVPRDRLSFVSPAHDGLVRPRKVRIGISSRVYPDGCKREWMLAELAHVIPGEQVSFAIMGSGWEPVVEVLRAHHIEVEYFPEFDLDAYTRLIAGLDYYLYMGLDEGSLGFLDAVAAAVPTIVTAQGFHLDVPGGITHSFRDRAELEKIICDIADERRQRSELVAGWTWREYARNHALIWEYLLCRTRGETIGRELAGELSRLGIKADSG